jgi:hypothetical protein
MLRESKAFSSSAVPYTHTSRIRNPLVGVSKAELLSDVTTFAKEHQLEDIEPLLIKGALVAQSPALFEEIEELDEADRTAIREEFTHRFKLPRTLYLTIILNSIAAAIQVGRMSLAMLTMLIQNRDGTRLVVTEPICRWSSPRLCASALTVTGPSVRPLESPTQVMNAPPPALARRTAGLSVSSTHRRTLPLPSSLLGSRIPSTNSLAAGEPSSLPPFSPCWLPSARD